MNDTVLIEIAGKYCKAHFILDWDLVTIRRNIFLSPTVLNGHVSRHLIRFAAFALLCDVDNRENS